MRLAGITLDMYDDRGALLAEKLSGDELKLAGIGDTTLLTLGQLNQLPDRLFAMVGTNDGDVVRKYAMVDRGHLATSMLYFLENKDRVPEELHPKIAANLVNACAWYDLDPPEELVKTALLGAALTALDGANLINSEGQRHKQDMARFRTAQMSGAKVADLNGSSVMPLSGKSVKEPSGLPVSSNKNAEWLPCGELSALEAVAKVAERANTHFAHPHTGKYPITTEEQLKTAAGYFDEYKNDFPPLERRVFAQSVHERAEELGVKVAGAIYEYAGESYGPHFEQELLARVGNFDGTPIGEGYKYFYEKRAAYEPAVMAQALAMLDARAGLFDRFVSADFRDAYSAVYSGGVKMASDAAAASTFDVWNVGNDTVSTDDLLHLRSYAPRLDALFGAGFGEKFTNDPRKTFLGMEDSQKLVLARLARRTT